MEEEKSLREQLDEAQQALKKAERQLEKSQTYNEELRQQIETLSTELHKYRSAAQHRQEAECQVEEKDIAAAYGDKPFPDWGVSGESVQTANGQTDGQTDGGSIADSLKAAAEEVVWQEAGFVYDNTSGLYYDYNSGYYYDSARSLYYDPSTTSYFYYDETEQTYKFHSYASGQYDQQASQSWEQENPETNTSQDSAAASQEAQQKHTTRKKKHHKHKDREVPKVQKNRVLKARRRTKASRHKSKLKEKDKDGGDMESKNTAENGVVVEDSDEEKEMKKDDKCDEKVEVMEIESSDSLATGESEMDSEPESGELTDQSSSSSSSPSSSSSVPLENTDAEISAEPLEYDHTTGTMSETEASASYPPCVRVIVQASDAVDVGTFFLIICTGGTIGRDKDPRHVIQIQDVNVSKVHAELKYDYDNSCYTVEDLASQNGTFVNNLRISESKEKSAAIPLAHGDTLQVGSTQMLLHIHPGNDTCDSCEPGQVMASLRAQQTVFNDHVVLSKAEKKKQAREQLKSIKKKYGLANSAYVDNIAALKNPDYADKADLRRRYVGSEHPSHQKRDQAPASVHKPISSENKGHRMLAKMGWKEGSGLGKDNAGRAEPVTVQLRASQTAGLGSTSSVGVSLDNAESANRTRRLLQTRERYQQLENSNSQKSVGRTSAVSTASSVQDGCSDNSLNRSPSGGGGDGNRDGDKTSGATSTRFQMNWIRGETQKPV